MNFLRSHKWVSFAIIVILIAGMQVVVERSTTDLRGQGIGGCQSDADCGSSGSCTNPPTSCAIGSCDGGTCTFESCNCPSGDSGDGSDNFGSPDCNQQCLTIQCGVGQTCGPVSGGCACSGGTSGDTGSGDTGSGDTGTTGDAGGTDEDDGPCCENDPSEAECTDGACVPSSCSCNTDSCSWICTRDCGGCSSGQDDEGGDDSGETGATDGGDDSGDTGTIGDSSGETGATSGETAGDDGGTDEDDGGPCCKDPDPSEAACTAGACVPSSCGCNTDSCSWICTSDCGGCSSDQDDEEMEDEEEEEEEEEEDDASGSSSAKSSAKSSGCTDDSDCGSFVYKCNGCKQDTNTQTCVFGSCVDNISTGTCPDPACKKEDKEHMGCVILSPGIFTCGSVSGEGEDECQSASDCYSNLRSSAASIASDKKSSEQATHLSCVGNSCITVDGAGDDGCTDNTECIEENEHLACVDNSCIAVAGEGENDCTDNTECIAEDEHLTCVDKACTAVDGEGDNDCTDNTGCIDEDEHLTCIDKTCTVVDGEGDNECVNNTGCISKDEHLACKDQACVAILSKGDNTCVTDAGCKNASSSSSSKSAISSVASSACPQCELPPSNECIGLGECGCGPYICPSSSTATTSTATTSVATTSIASSKRSVIALISSSYSSDAPLCADECNPPPPDPNCVGLGPCECGPYVCPQDLSDDEFYDDDDDANTGNNNNGGGNNSENNGGESFDPQRCGNGTLEPGEQCETGSTNYCTSSRVCNTSDCTCYAVPPLPNCGDGTLQQGEQCESGSINYCTKGRTCNTDLCTCVPPTSLCTSDNDCGEDVCKNSKCVEPVRTLVAAAPLCGNGIVDNGEQCDDGNLRSGDGCNRACLEDYDVTGTQVAADTSSALQQALAIPIGVQKALPTPSSVLADTQFASNTAQISNVVGGQFTNYAPGVSQVQNQYTNRAQVLGGMYQQQQQFGFPQYPNFQQLPYQLPLAQLQPLATRRAPIGDTGPAAVAVIGAGAAAGLSWIRRKRK